MRKTVQVLLLLFVFAIPWEYSLDLGAPVGNIARAIGLALLLIAIPVLLGESRWRNPGPLQWLTLALFLWWCCTCFWAVDPNVALMDLRGYAQEMMVVWLAWEFVDSPEDLRNLLRAWLAGSWVLVALTLADFLSPDRALPDQVRFAAIGQDPNDVARFIDLGFPIAAYLLDGRERRLVSVLALGYLPFGFAAVLLTGSRGGFLAAMAAMAGCGYMLFRRHSKRTLVAALSLPAMGALIWGIAPRETLERLGTTVDQLQNGDLNQRIEIWSAGWRAFLHAPIIGHGAGSFVIAAGLAPIDTAHNTILSILVEGGLCALLMAAGIVVVSGRMILAMRGSVRIALATMMAVWSLSALVGSVAESRTTWLLLAVIALSHRFEVQRTGEFDSALLMDSTLQIRLVERFE